MSGRKAKPKPKPVEEPEEDVLILTRVTEIEVLGREIVRGDEVRISAKRPFDLKPFPAAFMYAYVDQDGDLYEVTVYGGSGYSPGRSLGEQGEAQFRTVEPERVSAL